MKVSIITPSYNQGQFIERTLKSVAIQTGATIEHVVFDGGSTDTTVAILEQFEPPVRWVSKRDRGQADAVNQGIRATDGDIIGWLNSDDVYYPGAIAEVVSFFEANPDIDVAYGLADHIDVNDHPFETYPTQPWNFENLKETCFICQPALFFRRRVVSQWGLLDESLSYCMDYDYWLRLGKAGVKFSLLNKKLAGSRLYADNKTLGARVKVHAEINSMFLNIFGEVPDRWLFNYAHAVTEKDHSRENYPYSFPIRVGVTAVRAALKWNHRISGHMLRTICSWPRSYPKAGEPQREQ
ncbi:glycosyltransferase family 2 protein [Paraburkholderia adhaesiva]|uniref:glycosyltransferase family 2 protein n=1 Tax=Paraburkholderia adhaesiva TaxID=2883244 RepID=UPI001F21BBEF|nr:glycosyltransferase family 2 protein [Paraburkholderia adhaesiva]